jgi:glycosyltransferase involved in cell wall biosynthesis
MNILFVSPYVPSRIRVRPYNFIRALSRQGHSVKLVCASGRDDDAALEEMRSVCARVVTAPTNALEMLRNAARALPTSMPFQAALNCSPRLLELVRAEAQSGRHDVAHVEHLRGSALIGGLSGLPAVLDSVDCISLLFERALRGSPSLKSRVMALVDLARTRIYEAHYEAHYDRVLVSSPEDAWALNVLREQHRAGGKRRDGFAISATAPIAIVPNGVDLEYFAPQPIERAPATIVFSGKMSYHANAAAALFLVNDIMPRVWARRSDVRVVIAGSSPTKAVQALAADSRVEVTGYLADLRPAIAGATIAVCPLRYGVGIQNKILEAMAMATPTVAARQTTRALQAEAGSGLLLSEEPDEYADAILMLLRNPHQAARLGAAGRAYVEAHHNWDHAATRLSWLYSEAIEMRDPRTRSQELGTENRELRVERRMLSPTVGVRDQGSGVGNV